MSQSDDLYVERAADTEIYRHLRAGQRVFVSAPPGSGKTRLRKNLAERLRQNGTRCAELEMETIGRGAFTGATWYFALADAVALPLGLGDPLVFWQTHADLSPVERWIRYLRTAPSGAPLVLLIDEVESLLTRPHPADDFFRALDVADGGPVSVLLGNVEATALGANIMRADAGESAVRRWFRGTETVELSDFSRKEVADFGPWLRLLGADEDRLLDAITSWTGGHPGLTRTLAWAISQGGPLLMPGIEVDTVSAQVEALFLGPNRLVDPTMLAVLGRFDSGPATKMAALWSRVLAGEEPVRHNDDAVVASLCATGLVAPGGTQLLSRNRVFTRAFDAQWTHARQLGGELIEAANDWHLGGRASGGLLDAASLQAAIAWGQGRPDLSAVVRDFIWASVRVNPGVIQPAPAPVAPSEGALAGPPVVTMPPRGRAASGFIAGLLATVCVVFLWNTNADLERTKDALAAEKRAAKALLEVARRPQPAVPSGVPNLRPRGHGQALGAETGDQRPPSMGGETVGSTASTGPTSTRAMGTHSPWDAPRALATKGRSKTTTNDHDPMAALAPAMAFAPKATAEDTANTVVSSVTRDSLPGEKPLPIVTSRRRGYTALDGADRVVRTPRSTRSADVDVPELNHTETPIVAPDAPPLIRVIKLAPGAMNGLEPRSVTVGVGNVTNTPRTGSLAPIIRQIERQAPTYRRALLRCKRLDIPDTVAVRFRVNSRGLVDWAGVAEGDPGRVDQPCLVRTVRSFRFAPFEGDKVTATVRYRL